MANPPSHRHSFVLRIWKPAESRQRSVSPWRGWVQHIPSEENVYFHDMTSLVQFIEGWTDALEQDVRRDESDPSPERLGS